MGSHLQSRLKKCQRPKNVILSPSLTVTLSEAKSLISWLRINSAKKSTQSVILNEVKDLTRPFALLRVTRKRCFSTTCSFVTNSYLSLRDHSNHALIVRNELTDERKQNSP